MISRRLSRIVLALVFVSGLVSAASGQGLPAGFVDEAVVGGLVNPTAFTSLPDGRILVAEKSGIVRVVSANGQLLPQPFIDLTTQVNDYWDHGLLGIAADRDFATNRFVYLLYTYEDNEQDPSAPKTGRLGRVTASGDTAAVGSQVIILGTSVGSTCNTFPAGTDCIPSEGTSHSVGSVKVAADGTLFVSLGDATSFNVVDTDALRVQNLDLLAGKVLHITTAGKGIPGNPFWTGDANANRSKVWAYGLRNPYRMSIEPVSGLPYLGDVGWNTWEEINGAVTAGANFGWPCYEGNERQPGYEPLSGCQALYAQGAGAVRGAAVPYTHSSGGSAATGGTFYTGAAFPAQYRGAFFYGDYAVGFIRYFRVDSAGARSGPARQFAINANAPVYFDNDGQNLLYLSIISGEIRRIRYTGASADISYLSDREPSFAVNGFGPIDMDQSNGEGLAGDGRILNLNGVQFVKGLGVHAPAEFRFPLGGACSVFTASIGLDDEVGAAGGAVFQVFKDGAATPAYDSGLMTGDTPTKSVSVNLAGVNTLRLVVTNGGNGDSGDHADWADARVVCTQADVTPPTVSGVSPVAGDTATAVNANVTATFSEAIDPATLTAATVTLRQGSTAISGAVTYNAASRTVTLDPTAALTGSTLYTATIKSGAAGVKDTAGNALASDVVWNFTTIPTGTMVTYLSDRAFTAVDNGWGPAEKDRSNGEAAANDGATLTINSVPYAKGLGVHALSDLRFVLGGTCSALTAQVGVDDEVGATGSVIFQVFADSAATPLFDSGVITGTMAAQSVSVNVTGINTLRLVVTGGVDGNGMDHADWADARLTCSIAGDTTPPSVTAVSPPAAATGVAVNATVTATFSEAMTAASLTTSTVMLTPQGSGTPVSAAVTYSPATSSVTLDPTADLSGNTVYTATVKSGAAGAKDAAGNPLAADRTWTFTTGGSGTTVTYISDRPFTTIENGWGPSEKDRSNGEMGASDGSTLRLNGVTYAKGLGVHALSDIRVSLGAACSVMNAQIGIDDEITAGGSVIFQVFTDSLPTPVYQSGTMTASSATESVSVNVTGVNTLRLVVAVGPDGNSSDHADWADARVTCSSGGDTTAPTVTAVTPPAGATGAALETNVTATFSEPMGPATLTTTTVTLVPQGGTALAANVSYSAATNTVTLDPAAALVPNLLYTATIKGGSSGAKDAFGNALATDRVWTFRTDAPPVPTISQPVSTFKFKVGDTITYAGSATDPEQGNLPSSSLAWSIVLFHCPKGACHAHPFTNSVGSSGSLTAPDHGDDSYFEITLTATDSAGLTGSTTITVQPQTVLITLSTSPAGLQVIYGGDAAAAPATFTTIANSVHTIQVASPQGGLTFANWSDGGAQQHNVLVGTSNVTFTATFTDQTAPAVTTVTPAAGATGVAVGANVTGMFSKPMNAATITTGTVTLQQGAGAPLAAAVTYAAATNTVTLNPNVDLLPATTYTATIKGGASGVKDTIGNPLAGDRTWTFTTAGGGGGTTTFLSDRSWVTASNGWGPVERDRSNGESGATDGRAITLNGVPYTKGLGVHAPAEIAFALGSTCSLMTAQVGLDDEVGAGGNAVFQIFADGANTPLYDSGPMTGATATKSVSVNLAGVNTLRLVLLPGTDNGLDHGDWADAKVTCSAGGDTTPPTVTATTPAAAATGVAVNGNVTATFSEAMDPATLSTTTVTLVRQGSATAVPATVTYAAATQTVTLDPAADLAGNSAYTATIKSGSTGAKDAAANPLANDVVWTFTTASGGTTVTYLSDRGWLSMVNGYGPAENDRSTGENGAADGKTLTLNGVTYAKGVGVHAASDVRYLLSGACTLFTAAVGVDDEVGSGGSTVFRVFADNAASPIYDSGVMTGATPTKMISVSMAGVQTLRLVTTIGPDDATFDHGDWADAKLTCSSSAGPASTGAALYEATGSLTAADGRE